jgi:choline dehydrogenase-like flavoprotein
VPGFFAYRPDNTYSLQYHGEHRPRKDSRVFLSDDRDALGVPRLCIDVRFSDADVDGVIRAHNHWDRYLGELGAGRIRYKSDEPAELVRERLGAGFHQSGTTRMASRAEDGVVDAELTVHGLANLSVLSSSVFVTSSQANSTFLIVVLAVRLAERLRSVLGAVPAVQGTLAVQSEASDAAPTSTTVEPSTSVGDQRPA